MSISINGRHAGSIHFIGIFGSGMSALAQFLCWKGIAVSGSDRSLDRSESAAIASRLLSIGCTLFGQDGSGISDRTEMVCISTAIESDNPDIIAATVHKIPVVHRSDILAALVKKYRTVAVAGTSGKSTVTAMIFEFLSSCGKSPSLISGAAIRRLEREGHIGNAYLGTSDILVVEADESDGTIVKYEPAISVLLNVSKDHKSIEEVTAMFARLAAQSAVSIRNADDPNLHTVTTTHTFSLSAAADWRPDTVTAERDYSLLVRNAIEYRLPLRGLHNLSNCAAALAAAEQLGCLPEALANATPLFAGVDRRFVVTETPGGVTVVDDFAHNPEKIKAAVTAARTLAPRIIALFQPHGFGPTRFLRDEYRKLFSSLFFDHDVLCLLPIYYAGGTAMRDISSADLKSDLGETPFTVIAPDNRDEILPILASTATSGDCIVIMGARDPSLPLFTDKIIRLFSTKGAAAPT